MRQVDRVTAAAEPPGHRATDRLLVIDVEQCRHDSSTGLARTGAETSDRGRWYAFVRPLAITIDAMMGLVPREHRVIIP
jgi:hypothetical protein